MKNNPDYLEYFLPRREADGEYYDDATMKNGRHLTIVSTKIGADNKYLAFIQGDTPLSKIVTDQKNGKKILVIKDSYGNTFAQFPAEDYVEVHVIDLRFFLNDVTEYAKANGITDALVLYGVQNFVKDANTANAISLITAY